MMGVRVGVSVSPNDIADLYLRTLGIIRVHASSSERAMRVQISLTLVYLYMQTYERWSGQDVLEYAVCIYASFLYKEMMFTQEDTLTNL